MSRIVIVSHSHPLLKHGGGEVAAYRHYQHLRETGEDAAFVGAVIGKEDSARILGPDRYGVSLGDGDHLVRSTGMDAFLMEQGDPDFETWLVGFLAGFDAELYHFHHFWNIGAGTIRRLRAKRPDAVMLCTLHEFAAICANHGQMVKVGSNRLCHEAGALACANCMPWWSPLDHKLRRQRMHEMLMRFDRLISPSAFLRDRFVGWGIPEDRIAVIENGVPFRCRPDDGTGPADPSRAFATFCQATPTKGLDVLIDAAAHLEERARAQSGEIGFTIDVHGATEEEFRRICPERDIPRSVRFNGRYDPGSVIDLMSSAGWIVMPSIWWENSPVIIQEALAARVPMIVSNIGGMAEKVAGWGRTFKAGDARALAAEMLGVMGDGDAIPRTREAMPEPFHISQYQTEWSRLVADIGYGRLAAAE